MPLVTTRELLDHATRQHTGLPALNVIHLESAGAIAAAAERTGQGVVLQISQNCVRYHGTLAPIAAAARPSACRQRRKPWFGSCDQGTGPCPFQPARRRASSPRW